MNLSTLQLSEVIIEPLERVADEWQAHLGRFLDWAAAGLQGLSLENRSIVGLVNLIGREVGGVDVRGQARLERSSDAAKTVEFDATEKGVVLDLMRTTTTETVLGITNHAMHCQSMLIRRFLIHDIPSDQVFGIDTQRDVVGEVQSLPPVDNLAIGVVAILSTEWGPTD